MKRDDLVIGFALGFVVGAFTAWLLLSPFAPVVV